MTTPRSVPTWLAVVLERLELEQPHLVLAHDITSIAEDLGISLPATLIVQGLADRGWLLPSGVAGVWEFVPAKRAGWLSTNDPFITLRAALLKSPDLRGEAGAALESALWRRNFLDRPPQPHVVGVRRGTRVSLALRKRYRVVSVRPGLSDSDGLEDIGETPTYDLTTTLLHIADRPTDVRLWGEVLEALPDLIEEAIGMALQERSVLLPHASQARLAYLISLFDPVWANGLAVPRRGVVYFGPRDQPGVYNSLWNLYDSLIKPNPDGYLGD